VFLVFKVHRETPDRVDPQDLRVCSYTVVVCSIIASSIVSLVRSLNDDSELRLTTNDLTVSQSCIVSGDRRTSGRH
jgi:uncharacterized membrane protein